MIEVVEAGRLVYSTFASAPQGGEATVAVPTGGFAFTVQLPFLFEPGSATPRTLELRVAATCTGAGEDGAVLSARVSVYGVR